MGGRDSPAPHPTIEGVSPSFGRRANGSPSIDLPNGGTYMHEPDSLPHATGTRSTAVLHRLDAASHPATWPTVSAVVPTLNEAENLRWLLPRLSGVNEIIIVDGESDDGSPDVVRKFRPDAVIIDQPPVGKGAA